MSADDARPLETGWLADTPVTDNVLWGFLHNQVRYNALVAGASGGSTTSLDGLEVARSNTAVPYFNMAVLTRPLSDPADLRLGAAVEALAGAPALLLSVWPTPDLRPQGWELVGHPAFVLRSPGPLPHKPPPPGVEVVAVTGAGELEDFERVVVDGYPIGEAAGAAPGSVFGPALLDGPAHFRVGLLDGRPVGAGAVLVDSGVVNLTIGATLPAARRRGVWQSLVWSRVAEEPTLPAVAFTSDDSRPGFVRMGFAPVLRFTLWTRPA